MASARFGRRTFLLGTASATVLAACRDPLDRTARVAPPPPLALKGVNVDTDREIWRAEFVRHEMETIRRDLHCNAVFVVGSDLDRLTQAAAIAADSGLHVWFEPRRFDADAAETLAFLTSVAENAEELRREHGDVGLSLGVELTIFMDGLVPGANWSERGAALARARGHHARLNAFLDDALTAVRPIFGGQVTYSSGPWERVDWRDFDVLGIDMYRDAENAATFVEDVRALHRHGKPVVITEFGCCSYRGAEDLGGMGFDVVDWTVEPPRVQKGLVRDESVQAGYIGELLDIFRAERMHGAFVWNFIEPGSPYSPDPRFDFDMAGFALVKCYPSGHELAYERTGHFEPKAAFTTLAERFR